MLSPTGHGWLGARRPPTEWLANRGPRSQRGGRHAVTDSATPSAEEVPTGSRYLRRLGWQPGMGSLIKKRRKRMRKKKHKKMLKATRWQRRAGR